VGTGLEEIPSEKIVQRRNQEEKFVDLTVFTFCSFAICRPT